MNENAFFSVIIIYIAENEVLSRFEIWWTWAWKLEVSSRLIMFNVQVLK